MVDDYNNQIIVPSTALVREKRLLCSAFFAFVVLEQRTDVRATTGPPFSTLVRFARSHAQ